MGHPEVVYGPTRGSVWANQSQLPSSTILPIKNPVISRPPPKARPSKLSYFSSHLYPSVGVPSLGLTSASLVFLTQNSKHYYSMLNRDIRPTYRHNHCLPNLLTIARDNHHQRQLYCTVRAVPSVYEP